MLVNCRFTDHIFKHVFRFPISNYNPGNTVHNQNDLWHADKAVKKSVSKVSKGAKFSEGLSWSQQLAAKVEPIATHTVIW
jgi:hypothetical protein